MRLYRFVGAEKAGIQLDGGHLSVFEVALLVDIDRLSNSSISFYCHLFLDMSEVIGSF